MTIDNTQQRHQLGSMHFDNMPYSASPQFNNPWTTSGASYSSIGGYDSLKSATSRPTSMTMPFTSLPATAPSLASASYSSVPLSHADLLNPTSQSPYEQNYSTSPAQSTSYASSGPTYAPVSSYGQSLAQQQQEQSQRPLATSTSLPQPTSAYNDALDGARGMVAMSQNDITPRNIYGPRGDRGPSDGYGFPSTHSAHSSISSASGYNGSYYGSMDSSATDYSSASESMDGMTSRTLPRPSGLMAHALPPAPQSMMGSFNSKVSTSSQKKHKCKVCDKRFTRPSSLQTHMYSHTGEKRKSGRFYLIKYSNKCSICLRSSRVRSPILSRVQPPSSSEGPQGRSKCRGFS